MKKIDYLLLLLVPILGIVAGIYVLSPQLHRERAVSIDTSDSAQVDTRALEKEIKEEWLYNSDAPMLGKAEARVKIVVFSDYQCPYCKDAMEAIKLKLAKYPDGVQLIHRNFVVHATAEIHAKAAEAANLQGKFSEMDEQLFVQAPKSQDEIVKIATDLGLDIEKFKSDLSGDVVKARLVADAADADSLQLTGTPSVLINGKMSSINKLDSEISAILGQ